MADRKIRAGVPAEALTPEQQQRLEREIDDMLAVRRDEPATATDAADSTDDSIDEPAVDAADESGERILNLDKTPLVPKRGAASGPPALPAELIIDPPASGEVATPASENEAATAEIPPELPPEPAADNEAANPLDDPLTDAIIDASEAADKTTEQPARRLPLKRKKTTKKRRRWLLPLLVLAVLIALAAVPVSRAWCANRLGVRASVNFLVVDSQTQQGLAGAEVSVGGVTDTSDKNGVVNLERVKLGRQTLTIKEPGFAAFSRNVEINFGQNLLNVLPLQATGQRYRFTVQDFVSDQPVAGARVSSGQTGTVANGQGLVSLVLPKDAADKITVAASGYRPKTLELKPGSAAQTIKLAITEPVFYLADSGSTTTLYKAAVDGSQRTALLKNISTTPSRLALAVNQAGSAAALVSDRGNIRDQSGYILQALSFIDAANGHLVTADHAPRLQLIGWSGSRLVYVKQKPDAADDDPARYQLIAYNYQTNRHQQLAAANYFNAVLMTAGRVYYATSGTQAGDSSAFASVKPDGSDRQTIVASEAWNVVHLAYNMLGFETPTGWYRLKLDGSKPVFDSSVANAPAYQYVDSPSGASTAWITGSNVLKAAATKTLRPKTIANQTGIGYPVRWLDASTLLYRVSSSGVATDYVVSTKGGQPHQLARVVDAAGPGPWTNY